MLRFISRVFAVSLLAFSIADAKPARRFFEPEQPRETRNLTGTYALSHKGDTGAVGIARMKIWNQQGDSFLVGIAELANHPAVDWEGRGVFDGERGHYDWVFPDGKKGRTTFTVDKDGHIHGQVRGGGIDWNYVGRRMEKAAK